MCTFVDARLLTRVRVGSFGFLSLFFCLWILALSTLADPAARGWVGRGLASEKKGHDAGRSTACYKNSDFSTTNKSSQPCECADVQYKDCST